MELYSITLPNVIPLQLVTARATYGMGLLTSFIGGICQVFGVPNNMYAKKLAKAENLALDLLESEAKDLNADGIMDIHCHIDGLSFFVSGTAYKLSSSRKAPHVENANETASMPQEEKVKLESKEKAMTYWKSAEQREKIQIGRCEMCGSKKQELITTEIEDFFGKATRAVCFDCFCRYHNNSK